MKRLNHLRTRFLTLVHKTRGDMSFLDLFAYTVVISRETVKSPKNTIFDFCAQISKKYEFCDISANTVVKRCKKVKSSKKTIWDTSAQKSWSFVFCYIFAHTVLVGRKNGQIS